MSKRDRVISEKTEMTASATGVGGLVASTLVLGPLGPLLFCRESDEYTTKLRDDDNNTSGVEPPPRLQKEPRTRR
jgi:hypothetical protein